MKRVYSNLGFRIYFWASALGCAWGALSILAKFSTLSWGTTLGALCLAGLAILSLFCSRSMLLVSEDGCVRIVNALKVHVLEWSSIASFDVETFAYTGVIFVRLADGSRVTAWGTCASWPIGFPGRTMRGARELNGLRVLINEPSTHINESIDSGDAQQ